MVDQKIKPITTDFRTGSNEDLFVYVSEYAKNHTGGKLAPAIMSIIRDHKDKELQHQVLMVQGNTVLARS